MFPGRPMRNSGGPITNCPVCRYDLTGLPRNHRCPECGFDYDETMRVWYGRKPRWWVGLVSITPMLLMLGALLWNGLRFGLPATVYMVYLVAGLPVPLIILLITALLRRSRSFMLVADLGLYSKLELRRMQFWPWSELLVPPPADTLIRRPLGSAYGPAAAPSVRGRFIRFLTRDLGGLNRNQSVFRIVNDRLGVRRQPMRLSIASLNAETRRVAYQELHQRWSRAMEQSAATQT